MATADELKAKGNAAFAEGRHDDAVVAFGDAIALDPSNHVLHSNRSAAHAAAGRFDAALVDAEETVRLKPDWPRGYSRLGAALVGLGRPEEASKAYEQGLALDPSSEALKSGLADARSRVAAAAAPPPPGAADGESLFGPAFLARLASDPRTASLLADDEFLASLRAVDADPAQLSARLGDPRFQAALQVGLGVTLAPGGPGGPAGPGGADAAEAAAGPPPPAAEPVAQPEAPPPPPPPEPTPEEAAAAEAKAAANAAKERGNAAYKAKDFAAAIDAYTEAVRLAPGDATYLNNRAAARLEAGDVEGALADCDESVAVGRDARADYKVIARALARRGTCLSRLGRLEEAVEAFQKSLTEHRSADTLKKLTAAEKALKDARAAAYVDLALADEAREAGNAAFKDGDFPAAVRHYTEALARGPPGAYADAHKTLSNRAACYTKLGAWADGVRDADACIALAPDFVKGYSRKGLLQYFMKEYDKALETYEAGLKVDPASEELKDGAARCVSALRRVAAGGESAEEQRQRQERALADPEVQQILTDPVMRQVLQDFQDDPAAAQRHASQPEVMAKIQKLVAAGIVRVS